MGTSVWRVLEFGTAAAKSGIDRGIREFAIFYDRFWSAGRSIRRCVGCPAHCWAKQATRRVAEGNTQYKHGNCAGIDNVQSRLCAQKTAHQNYERIIRRRLHRERCVYTEACYRDTTIPLSVAPNLQSLHEISPPVDTLQEIVLGRLSATGRALAATTALADAIRNLNNAIEKRNNLIERIKDERLPEGAKVHHFYFGMPYAEGKSNEEYGSYVKALALYTDDTIFFSIKLYEDLREHGLGIAKKYKIKFGGEAPGISHINWKKLSRKGCSQKMMNTNLGFPAT